MSALLPALQITAVGMGLVFIAIILLWWMMILLTWFTSRKDSGPGQPSWPAQTDINSEEKVSAQAAAAAVALALAEQERPSGHPLLTPPTAIVSAWQLGLRTRQISEKGDLHRSRRN
jgi:Na+-transporting methylmalonyl-CoA/oxaloacetate decarboxylase gamma subunit